MKFNFGWRRWKSLFRYSWCLEILSDLIRVLNRTGKLYTFQFRSKGLQALIYFDAKINMVDLDLQVLLYYTKCKEIFLSNKKFNESFLVDQFLESLIFHRL